MWLAGLLVPALIGSAIALTGCTRETPGTAMAPSGVTALPQSDEDQITDLVERFEQAWNDRRFGALRDLMCAEMRGQSEFDEDALQEARSGSGLLDLAITELAITGDTAEAVIENDGDDPDDIAFVREDDEWTWCEF
ncbi:Rv0361 family membrane protein [Mycolicibacterium fluoranthenivorans]|uniref:DUF4878 domain-containing protein n=1 Tax=Mycolicibacterium fluoranthenivorans TaxID=258505 RepID=A0A7X5TWB8_9MYCO|nr:hypothetical protein [Mycolicibacterium fluoranthenivorans]MCV7355270.1 hypothetical protein [Mycolicibacterium fluoranthenivorans]NIH93964.1 hypothetical protein [Mycolicibacterium fluoranthenivorans]